jgi:hypothetical protein
MFTPTRSILAAAIILGAADTALAADLPNIDMQNLCRSSGTAPFADRTATFEVCMRDEQAARQTLLKDWANVPRADKSRCVLPAEYLPSYIEWLTCLEIENDIRTIRYQQPVEQSARAPVGGRLFASHTTASGKK